MITANEGGRHKAYAEMLGVDEYLRKPFAMDVLLEAVERIIGSGEDERLRPGSSGPSRLKRTPHQAHAAIRLAGPAAPNDFVPRTRVHTQAGHSAIDAQAAFDLLRFRRDEDVAQRIVVLCRRRPVRARLGGRPRSSLLVVLVVAVRSIASSCPVRVHIILCTFVSRFAWHSRT